MDIQQLSENQRFFLNNQKLLLKIANSEEGRYLLGVKNKLPIVKITPNSWHFLQGEEKDGWVLKGHFYTFELAAKILKLPFIVQNTVSDKYAPFEDPFEAFLHFSGLRRLPNKYPTVYCLVKNYYAGTGDGYVRYNNGSWSTCRNAGSGDWTERNGEIGVDYTDHFWIYRYYIPIDTSSIGNAAKDLTGKIYLWGNWKKDDDNDGYDYIVINQGNQANTAALATSDYGLAGSVEGSNQIDITGANSSGYNTFTLNATGNGWINKTGWSKFGAREGHDIADHQHSTGGNTSTKLKVNIANQTPGTYPYLEATYKLPGGGFLHGIL